MQSSGEQPANEGAFGTAEDAGAVGEPLTIGELGALPEGTPLVVIWSGGNGPHRYVLVWEWRMPHAARPDDLENSRMRTYNPLSRIGAMWYHTRVWRCAEPETKAGS